MRARYPKDLAKHVHSRLPVSKEGPIPSLAVMERLFETLFIASLKKEEAEEVSCRVAFVDRANPDPVPPKRIVEDRWKYFALRQDLPFNVRNLAKLSKAVDPWSSTLAVDVDSASELRIWGLIDQSVHHSTFVTQETDRGPEMPGIFQAKIEGVGEVAAYRRTTFIGRLRQDTLITGEMGVLRAGPIHDKLLPAIRRFRERIRQDVGERRYAERSHWDVTLEDEWLSTLSRILIGIQRYGHGGAVLLGNPTDGLSPRYSLEYPRLSEALFRSGAAQLRARSLSDKVYLEYAAPGIRAEQMPVALYLAESVAERELRDTQDEIKGCIRFLSSLSRVDGLVWLNHDLALQGFGVVITSEDDPDTILRALNASGTRTAQLDFNSFGTRHRSMIRQCARDRESVGFVVSQDGDVRAISNVEGKILIWENIRLQRFVNTRPAIAKL